MQIIDLIRLAFLNVKVNKTLSKKIIFGMTIIFVLNICFVSILFAYQKYKREFNEKHKSDCFFYSVLSEQELNQSNLVEIKKLGEENCMNFSAIDINTFCDITFIDEEKDLCVENIRVELEEKEYCAEHFSLLQKDISKNLTDGKDLLEMAYYSKGMEIFPRYLETEIIGNYPDSEGEIMVDDYLLEVFGLNGDLDDIIGKTISLVYCEKNKTREYLFHNYKITGIFDSGIISRRESIYSSDLHAEHVYINLRKNDMHNYKIYYGSLRYYFDGYADFVSNYEASGDLIMLNFENIVSDENEIHITQKAIEYCVIYFLIEKIGKIIWVIGTVLSIIIIFSILYLLSFYRDRQKQYRVMIQYMGMKRVCSRCISVFENSILVGGALIIACYFSVIILHVLNYVMTIALGFSVTG